MPVSATTPTQNLDVALIGGGIMSATLGALIKQLEPGWTMGLFENLDQAGLESSGPWNNAGTGHSALCELNYTPAAKDGSVDPAKAVGINEQYQVSRQFYAYLVEQGHVGAPESFINPLPHMSFVLGDAHADYLRTRYEALKAQPLFEAIEHTEDLGTIGEWAPLVAEGRDGAHRVAASRVAGGTDVDFGSLTRQLTSHLGSAGTELHFGHRVTRLERSGGGWTLTVKNNATGQKHTVHAKFVFVGAGGGALHLLQLSGIPEIKGFGGFPVSGQFLRNTNDATIARHHAKVYGQASVGAPPMSVPHLDTRFVDGKRSLMFGPYAGFSTNFLKTGSFWDLPRSLRLHNLLSMLAVGKDNLDLTAYLVKEVLKSRGKKDEALREYFPGAVSGEWELITAGQRVQVIKKDPRKGGVLQFGTEVITSADGTISGLLGASPGASTAAPIMIEVLRRCFPAQFGGWESKLTEIIPSHGTRLNENPALLAEVTAATDSTLKLA
ncbi:malate:quinone oxidoreductase [Zafaria sp. Z1313]|uniref:malate:quinone oxidoreductase n=1 Tax=unclassified Zafaria TaxID=2828765 RepID=UPI002E763F64|nr:malate:quinone oxidoreductase [Zafaria sp. J156]MEE1620790.1 malate:quinone oxidoreductase [Zafaria sp. J156]